MAMPSRRPIVRKARVSDAVTADDAPLAALLSQLTTREPAAHSASVSSPEIAAPPSIDVATALDWTTKVTPELFDVLPPDSRFALRTSIEKLLRERPDPDLAAVLAKLETPDADERSVPRDWSDFLASWTAARWSTAMRFLDWSARPSASDLAAQLLHAVLDRIEEALTDPTPRGHERLADEIAPTTLLRVLDDLRLDPHFPRGEHAHVHQRLFDLWIAYRGGSARREDAALFLLLADALLQVDPNAGADIAERIDAWWRRRPSFSLLPFLLDALSLVSHYTPENTRTRDLWFEAAGLVRCEPLVAADAGLHAYSATFAAGHADSIVPSGTREGQAIRSEWWTRLSDVDGPVRGAPRSIADVAREDSSARFVVIGSPSYVDALEADLCAALEVLRSKERMIIVTGEPGPTDDRLREVWIPSVAVLTHHVGGALPSLHARVAQRILEEAPHRGLDSSALRRRWTQLAARSPALEKPNRRPSTDDEVKTFIRRALGADHKAKHSRLLRELRASGRACEQSRFKELFQQVAGERAS